MGTSEGFDAVGRDCKSLQGTKISHTGEKKNFKNVFGREYVSSCAKVEVVNKSGNSVNK